MRPQQKSLLLLHGQKHFGYRHRLWNDWNDSELRPVLCFTMFIQMLRTLGYSKFVFPVQLGIVS